MSESDKPELIEWDPCTYKVLADWHEERGEIKEADKLRFEAVVLGGMPKALTAYLALSREYTKCCGGGGHKPRDGQRRPPSLPRAPLE